MKMVPESWYYILGYWIILEGGCRKKKISMQIQPNIVTMSTDIPQVT